MTTSWGSRNKPGKEERCKESGFLLSDWRRKRGGQKGGRTFVSVTVERGNATGKNSDDEESWRSAENPRRTTKDPEDANSATGTISQSVKKRKGSGKRQEHLATGRLRGT